MQALKQKYLEGKVLFVSALLKVSKEKDYLDTLETLLAWDKEKAQIDDLARRKAQIARDYPDGLHRGDEIYLLFESVCPMCYGDVEVTMMSGSAEFLEDRGDDNIKTRLWAEVPVHAEIGDITFKCSNGHEHFIVKHWDGDWS